ncbi:MAG: hypothetical protein HYY96_12085 [Candidatus Tectomicrobia bacterium]|nr:hypothetical protein [Candidatus Tectomicrobia bacterium]
MAFHVFRGHIVSERQIYYIGTSLAPKPLVIFRSLDELIKYFPPIESSDEISFALPVNLQPSSGNSYEVMSEEEQQLLLRALHLLPWDIEASEEGKGRSMRR